MTTDPAPKAAAASASPAVNGAAADGWDEPRLQTALERLQELHIQLRRLRDAVPSLVRPIHAAADANAYSPESLYGEVRSAARSAQDGVRRFRAILKDPDTKAALSRAREAQQPEGNVESWLVEQHAQWLDEPAVRSAREFEVEDDVQEGLEPVKEEEEKKGEDVAGIVKRFKERHPDVDIRLLDSINSILVQLPPAKLTFTILWHPNAPGSPYEVATKGPTKLHSSINQGLARRAHKEDLNWTLELLSDYMNIKQQRCYACNRLLDDESRFATVKLAKPPTDADDSGVTQWDSFHLDCS